VNINPFDVLKNAQKLQEQMGSLQEKMAGIQITGASGGGMVEIDMNGRMEVIAVRIAPEIVNPDDVEMLQDLVAAAFAAAADKMREEITAQMGSLAGDLGIGGLGAGGFPGLT
jgi:DNA-binding YbaB/EbfC family protein